MKVKFSYHVLVAINRTRAPLPPSIRSLKEVPGYCCSIYSDSIIARGNRFFSDVSILVLYCCISPLCFSMSCLYSGLEDDFALWPWRWHGFEPPKCSLDFTEFEARHSYKLCSCKKSEMYSPFLKKFEHFYPSNTFRQSRITISRLFGSQLESRIQGLVIMCY